MGKKKKQTKRSRTPSGSASGSSSIPTYVNRYFNLIVLLIFAVLIYSQFFEYTFLGKTFNAADASAGTYAAHFTKEAVSKGYYPQWTPYIFSGMPSFGSMIHSIVYPVDIFHRTIIAKLPFSTGRVLHPHLLHFIFGALGLYLLLRHLKLARSASLLGAITFMLMPHFVGLIPIAHGGKLWTIMYIPWTFYAILRLLESPSLFYLALAGLTIGLQLLAQHPQIAYYTLLMLGAFTLYWVIIELAKRNFKVVLGGGLCAIAVLIGFALSYIYFGPVQEYSHYSIRGVPPALDTTAPKTGLSHDYATSWSFPPEEIITFFVPAFYGVGEQGGFYWGQMPFTQNSLYMGLLPLLLSAIALLFRRNRITVFMLILGIVSLLVSFGRHFPLLSEFLLNHLPYFNKFRVPAMVLVLLEFAVAVLAGFGLQVLLDQFETVKKKLEPKFQFLWKGLATIAAVSILISLIFAVGGNGLYQSLRQDGMFTRDRDRATYDEATINYLAAQRFDMAKKDVYRMTFFMVVSCALLILAIQRRLNRRTFVIAVLVVLTLDLWLLNRRFTVAKAEPTVVNSQLAITDPVADFLKQDTGKFRILSLGNVQGVGDLFQNNIWAYYLIESMGGYHAAKLRVIQDMFDYVLFPNGQLNVERLSTAMAMFNGKYLVVSGQFPHPDFRQVFQSNGMIVYQNLKNLPRAYLVDRVKVLTDPKAIFDELKSPTFNPAQAAVLESTYDLNLGEADSLGYFSFGDKTGSTVQVTDFDIHQITLHANIAQECLLVLSEVNYPPGWHAYINGEKVDIYKTNYALRSIRVPAGEHTIEFKFQDPPFRAGVISGSVALLFILLVFGWEFGIKKRRQL
ncbi:MAG: hypothetical protein D6675_05445 [Gemmatimonadetes bacterium]|nr:MAG: hypothetical protein D6675_05445 [Gemmatimonadota bacterium]